MRVFVLVFCIVLEKRVLVAAWWIEFSTRICSLCSEVCMSGGVATIETNFIASSLVRQHVHFLRILTFSELSEDLFEDPLKNFICRGV